MYGNNEKELTLLCVPAMIVYHIQWLRPYVDRVHLLSYDGRLYPSPSWQCSRMSLICRSMKFACVGNAATPAAFRSMDSALRLSDS